MMKIQLKLKRATRIVTALVLGVATLMPGLLSNTASADQLGDRSITMSTSAANASGVSYQVKFTTVATAQSIVLDFCGDSPIIGSTCGSLAGFSASSATITGGLTNWSITGSGTNIKLLKNTGSATGVATITFTLGGIHNPTAVGTFYARAYTYANATASGYTDPDTLGTTVDTGGFALSTANQVSVTGTVQESLTFCVTGTTMTDISDCADASDPENLPDLVLGHGTPIATLTSDAVDTANAYSMASTNAGTGLAIRMRSSNSCGGLSRNGGSQCDIGPVAGGSTTPAAIGNGAGKFGMKASTTDADLTIDTPYAHATNYGMEWDDNDVTGITSPFGSRVAYSDTVLDSADTTYTFAAGATNTTPAGIYTATMTLIATGTY